MPVASQPRSAPTGVDTPSAEIAILWLTAGLSCDGDSVAMTAATQPSLEDLLSGAIPLALLESGLAAARGVAVAGGAAVTGGAS